MAEGSMSRGYGSETFAFVRSLNPGVQELERIAEEIAPTSIPVLLVGESGTGKEVFALQIHRQSGQRDSALVKMRCASLGADSLTQWLRDQDGQTRKNGAPAAGTVFFDEVSELDAACQRILLHALPDGDTLPRKLSLSSRTVFSTCRSLEGEMQTGQFRSDLYYRINGICLRLPPLRQRKEDIAVLTEAFLAKYATFFGRERPPLKEATLEALREYSWPGNIRELENVVKKIVALGDEQVAVADIAVARTVPGISTVATKATSLKTAARQASFQAERELILKTLARTRWNRKRAAQELQISYKSLLGKLKQIRLDDSEFHEL
jgi:two-component system response regulator AtoC